MNASFWRGSLIWGLSLALFAGPLRAEDSDVLSLEDALRQAGVSSESSPSQTNPRIAGQVAESEAAQAAIEQAKLRPNPTVSLEAENIAGTGPYSGLSATEYSLTAGLPLEIGGKRSARVRAAQAALEVARLRSDYSVAELGHWVRQRYFAAVAAEARVKLAQDILARNAELSRIATELVDAGREPPLRAMRACATLAQAEADLNAAEVDALARRLALGALWSAEAPPEVPSDFPILQPPSSLIAGYSGFEARIAQAEREAAQAEAAHQRTLAIPDPTISAGVRRFQESNDNAFLVGVSIALPLFDRNQGNIAAADARARSAEAREAVALADYRQAIADARAAFLAADAKATTLDRESLPQAEEALRLAQIGYRNGRFPLIEVLAAADARDGIRRALIDARESRGRAAAQLVRLAAQ